MAWHVGVLSANVWHGGNWCAREKQGLEKVGTNYGVVCVEEVCCGGVVIVEVGISMSGGEQLSVGVDGMGVVLWYEKIGFMK